MDNFWIPEYWLTGLGSWAISYLIHSTVILGSLLLLARFVTFISQSSKDALLKVGLVAGILTASIQFVQSSNGAFVSTLVFDIDSSNPPIHRKALNSGRTMTTDNLQLMVIEEHSAFENQSGVEQNHQRITINWLNGLLLFWLFGSLFFALRFAWLWRKFNHFVGIKKKLSHQPTIDLCQRLKLNMGIRGVIKLTVSENISSPMAIGLAQICLPNGLWLQVNEEQMTAIVAHELAHISRTDPVWLFFWHLMSVVFFFQPLNKLTQLSFQSRAEFLADATAVQQTKDPIAMVNSLVSAAKLATIGFTATMAANLLGASANIVERSRLLLSENPLKTKTPLSLILLVATLMVTVLVWTLPSISLASRLSEDIINDYIKLTPDNSKRWQTYSDTQLRFPSYLSFRESIAGRQIAIETKRLTFSHNLDGIAKIQPAGELRFVSRSIYGETTLLIQADWLGEVFYQFRVDGELVESQQAALRFMQQTMDLALGKSDEFKRNMLRLYVKPQVLHKVVENQWSLRDSLERVIDNVAGFYADENVAMARVLLASPDLLKTNGSETIKNALFINGMAHRGSFIASFNTHGFLSLSVEQPDNISLSRHYSLNNQRLLDAFIATTGNDYKRGETERALVKFMIRLYFDVEPKDIKWLME
jgi:beta-lactamase regulating signal transducer with metallopeptidase domain